MTPRRAWIRLIQPGLQWRLVSRMGTLLALATVLTGVVVVGWILLTERRLGGELFLVTTAYGQDPAKVPLTTLVWPALALALGLNPVLAVLFLLRYSLRIAGPAYRLEQALQHLGTGDHTLRVHLRPGDELQGLAAAVNVRAGSMADTRDDRRQVPSVPRQAGGAVPEGITPS